MVENLNFQISLRNYHETIDQFGRNIVIDVLSGDVTLPISTAHSSRVDAVSMFLCPKNLVLSKCSLYVCMGHDGNGC